MTYKKIIRNLYAVKHPPRPHDSNNHNQDMIDFHLTSQHMQNANLHDWGIARGLEVSGKIGSKEIVVYPGAAIDIEGKLISLATKGHGDIGPNPPGYQHHPVPVPVRLSTEGFQKRFVYVTIRYSEIKQSNAGVGGLMEQVPWIRLQPVSGPSPNVYAHDGKTIILAVAYIDTNQELKSLSYENDHVFHRRQVIGQSIKELRIQRSVKAGDRVKEKESAVIGPADNGGLEIRANRIVAKDSSGRDVLIFNNNLARLFIGTKGNEGDLRIFDGSGRKVFDFDSNLAVLKLGANGNEGDLRIFDGSGRNVFDFDSNLAVLKLGANGNEGDLRILDNSGRVVFDFDSNLALLKLGANGNEGDLVVRNNSGAETARLDGQTGRLISNGRIIAGNPARYARTEWLVADNGTDYRTVDLGSTRQVFAFATIVACNPRADFDGGDLVAVDIYSIDGNVTDGWLAGGDWGSEGNAYNLKQVTYRGQAQKIQFRARSRQDATVVGIGVVFHE